MRSKLLFSAASLLSLCGTSVATDCPLVTHRWTADPSAHVFNKTLYIYASHDEASEIVYPGDGGAYAMRDYHVYSTEKIYESLVVDHGVGLSVDDVPWASHQMWAPDAAYKNGKYYLYFPAKDKDSIFRIGVAVSSDPGGPFKADKSWIPNTFSIDPTSFVDTDDNAYLAWGGIQGGQLQNWQNKNKYNPNGKEPPNGTAALAPQIAKLSKDMHKLAEKPRDIKIVDPKTGKPLLSDDKDRRFFEGPWIYKRGKLYYLVYSTGETHYMVYATSKKVYGPYTYQGRILEPIDGWTTHGSILEYQGQDWLFYHDAKTSGKDHLRQVKAKKIWYDSKGKILTKKP
ncbi:hypothetical protein ACHAPU_010839 [Fusarium lateritium]